MLFPERREFELDIAPGATDVEHPARGLLAPPDRDVGIDPRREALGIDLNAFPSPE